MVVQSLPSPSLPEYDDTSAGHTGQAEVPGFTLVMGKYYATHMLAMESYQPSHRLSLRTCHAPHRDEAVPINSTTYFLYQENEWDNSLTH